MPFLSYHSHLHICTLRGAVFVQRYQTYMQRRMCAHIFIAVLYTYEKRLGIHCKMLVPVHRPTSFVKYGSHNVTLNNPLVGHVCAQIKLLLTTALLIGFPGTQVGIKMKFAGHIKAIVRELL